MWGSNLVSVNGVFDSGCFLIGYEMLGSLFVLAVWISTLSSSL